jgi:membrane-bound metal-dependent hydrolase YbcI (DUF457 family)
MATGPTHAMSGLLAWGAVSLGGLAAIASGAGGHAVLPLSSQTWTVGAALATGAALLPDIDHPESTIARTFGSVSEVASRGMHELSHVVYRVTRTRKDSNRHGGHRGLTHTLVFGFFAGLATIALMNTNQPWVLPALLFVFCGLAVRGLLHEWTPRGHALAVTLITVALTWVCWRWLTPLAPGQVVWCGIAVITGCVAHYLGDAITEQGCPMLWPLPILGRTWFPVAPPKALRMRTGGRVELLVVLPGLSLLAVWLTAAALHRLGLLPWLDRYTLLPT